MPPAELPRLAEEDRAAVAAQLGRPPRAAVAVAYRCPCGKPAVVATAPRLADGTPFPTTYYLTCARLNSRLSTLESAGLMRELQRRIDEDEEFAAAYDAAHRSYVADRDALGERIGLGEVPEIAGVSAGGMPERVKCLHALVAHALAAGPGVNPAGDEALAQVGNWWQDGACG